MCAARDIRNSPPPPPSSTAPEHPAPDSGLSAAIRNALGSGHEAAHVPDRFLKTGQALAKQAKVEKPPVRTIAPRKGNIGPRSGHK